MTEEEATTVLLGPHLLPDYAVDYFEAWFAWRVTCPGHEHWPNLKCDLSTAFHEGYSARDQRSRYRGI
jgi:hypothetical protein